MSNTDMRYLFLSLGSHLTCKYKEGLKYCRRIKDKELALKIELFFILKFRKYKIFLFIQSQPLSCQAKLYRFVLNYFMDDTLGENYDIWR